MYESNLDIKEFDACHEEHRENEIIYNHVPNHIEDHLETHKYIQDLNIYILDKHR